MALSLKLPGLCVCGGQELVQTLPVFRPQLVVSILDPGMCEPGLPANGIEKIVVRFHDDFSDRRGRVQFDTQMADLLRSVGEQVGPKRVLVHCAQGISRSSAVALAWLVQGSHGLDPAGAVELLADLRPVARPNLRVLSLMLEDPGLRDAVLRALSEHPTLGWRPRPRRS